MSYAPEPPAPMRPEDEKTWAILIHLSGFVVSFLGALIGYLVLRDRGPFIRFHTAQALNLALTFVIGTAVSLALLWVVVGIFTSSRSASLRPC